MLNQLIMLLNSFVVGMLYDVDNVERPTDPDAFEYSEDANIDAFIANADESFGSDVYRIKASDSLLGALANAPPASDVVVHVEEPTQSSDPMSTAAANPIAATADVAMDEVCPSTEVEPWMLPTLAQTPEEIAANGELVSALLSSEHERVIEDETMEELVPSSTSCTTSTTEESAVSTGNPPLLKPQSLEGFTSLCERWPTALEERRKICYLPSLEVAAYYERNRTTTPCILYWMRNTLRVSHGNFALEAALLLAERLGLPVVTMCLVPCAIVYPTCHSTNANDAFARWSYADVYQQLCQAGLPFLGFTGSTAPKKIKSAVDVDDADGFPLFQLIESFSPYVVITDDACDLQASRNLHQLTQFLHATPSSSPWGLFAIDSNTCLPMYSRSEMARRTLAAGERFLSEDEFSHTYTECFQDEGEPYSFTAIERAKLVEDFDAKSKRDARLKLLRQLEMEEVNWRIVESLNRQCSPEMAPFSEMDALQKLDRLLGESSDRPAIQAELQASDCVTTCCDEDAEL